MLYFESVDLKQKNEGERLLCLTYFRSKVWWLPLIPR